MIMKHIKLIILLLAGGLISLFAPSCINDTGNYEYEDASKILPVTVADLPETTVIVGNVLKIVPEVSNDNGNYTYSWFVTPSVTAGILPQKTILSTERTLDVPIKLDVGSYFLSFEVRNPELNIYVRKQTDLRVTASDIVNGWYVLKDINNETDFDYINREGTLRVSDVLLNRATPENSRLKGTAVQITYQSQRYYQLVTDAEGKVTTLANQQVLHILSSQDIKVFNANTMGLFKNFEDIFYGPEICNPQSIKIPSAGYGDIFLINDGKIYALFGMGANVGKLSAPKIGFYSMHSDMLSPSFSNMLCFDMVSRSFFSTTSSGNTINPMNEESASAVNPIGVSPTNMPYTLVNLLKRAEDALTASGYALMQDERTNQYFLASVTFSYMSSTAYPFLSFNPIPVECKMPLAEVKAAPYSGNFVYYAENGNQVWVYRDAEGLAQRENKLLDLPAGETISYMTCLYAAGATGYNYLVILTNSASGWKMYIYNVLGLGNPELTNDAPVTYTGTGNARFVMYR